MDLFIRIKDGVPFEHPIMGDNFREAFPHVDTNNLPAEFARFERVAAPVLGPYDKNIGLSYVMGADRIVRDTWTVDRMTEQERLAKQEAVKAAWNNMFPSWTFNEELCRFVAPVAEPTDGKRYRWDESQLNWVEVV